MKIRKAILTGGGRATRLYPITTTINKHLIPLANKPMIFHAIEKAVEAGVEEIFINTNPGETELQKHIGDGGHWGIKIKFFEQTGGPQGIAHVVKCAKDLIGDEPFMFYLSDNILFGDLKGMFAEFEKEKYDCMLAFAKVPDARHFGVPTFDEKGKLIDVIEKPQNPQNNFAQTGIYLYSPKVFFQTFSKIQKSNRGEYEISDIHSYLLKNNFKVGWKEITGWWKDTGQPEDLITASRLLMEAMPVEKFKITDGGSAVAEISGNVAIGIGVTFGKNVKIVGPAIIGVNCTLDNCKILSNTTIGTGTTIRNATIADSIVLGNSEIDCDLEFYNSIIGENVKIHRKSASRHGKIIVGDHTVMDI